MRNINEPDKINENLIFFECKAKIKKNELIVKAEHTTKKMVKCCIDKIILITGLGSIYFSRLI